MLQNLTLLKSRESYLSLVYATGRVSCTVLRGRILPSVTANMAGLVSFLFQEHDPIFKNIEPGTQVWMSHADTIASIPDSFEITGSTADVVAELIVLRRRIHGDTVSS